MSDIIGSCLICGGSSFDLENGAKICTECGGHQMQFVELVEEYDEAWEFNRSMFIGSKLCPQEPGLKETPYSGSDWCTFEAYNIILKKWTDALLHFGASPKFKDAVFKLWVRYLQERKVAFSKKDKNRASEKDKYAKVLTKRDVINLEGIVIKKKRTEEPQGDKVLNGIKEKIFRVKNRMIKSDRSISHAVAKEMSETLDATNILQEFENITQEGEMEVDPDQLEASNYERKPLIYEEDEENELLVDDVAAEVESETAAATPAKEIPFTIKRILTLGEKEGRSELLPYYSPLYLNLPKVLSLVYLALLIAEEDILLLDLLRWCREGYLPYQSAGYLVPKTKQFQSSDFFLFNQAIPAANEMRIYAGSMAGFLSVQAVPLPSHEACLKKMAEALFLPDDVKGMVLHAMESLMLAQYGYLQIPAIETLVAAAILLAFKVVFGLDGVHEELLSDAADKLNQILTVEKKDFRLFSWRKWHCHMNRVDWWMNETCIQSTNFNNTKSRKVTLDAKRFNNYVWSEGIWKVPIAENSSQRDEQITWDYSLLNYALALNMESLEKNIQHKPLFELYRVPNVEPVQQYLTRSCSSDKSVNKQRSYDVAYDIFCTSFSAHRFNWLMNCHEVEAVFKSFNKPLEIVKVPLAAAQRISENLNSVKAPRREHKIKLLVPNPLKSYWAEHTPNNYVKLPGSFKWLVKLLSRLCETCEWDLYHRFIYLEKKYLTQVKDDARVRKFSKK